MRIYQDFKEAHGEVARDIVEMGLRVYPQTYQNKFIGDKPEEFGTLEVQNYIYTVTGPKAEDLTPVQPWADMEFEERVSGLPINPGAAWETRAEVWTEFLDENGRFHYTYPERLSFNGNLDKIIDRLKADPDSRQCFLPVFHPTDLSNMGGISRVPCTIGYQFQVRGGQLNMTYLIRSNDFVTHFQNDVYLAFRLQEFVANKVGVKVGNFTHWAGSLHMYRKDAKGIF